MARFASNATTTRVARKPYECCACGAVIAAGSKYRDSNPPPLERVAGLPRRGRIRLCVECPTTTEAHGSSRFLGALERKRQIMHALPSPDVDVEDYDDGSGFLEPEEPPREAALRPRRCVADGGEASRA